MHLMPPQPIFQWIEKTRATNKNVIVISVSGGGEVWPNIGTRFNCIIALEKNRVLKPNGLSVFSELFLDPDYPLSKP